MYFGEIYLFQNSPVQPLPMADPEYMRLRLEIIPEKIIVKYNLRDLVDADGWVYVEIRKGMYGLPQAGIIANQLLEK